MVDKLILNEKEVIKLYLENRNLSQTSKIFNCSLGPIKRILKENNIKILTNKYFKRWTNNEDNFIKENYNNMTNPQISKSIGKTSNAVNSRICKLKLNRSKDYRTRMFSGEKNHLFNKNWSKEQIIFLKENYKSMTNKEIAKTIGKAEYCIAPKSNRLGLFKPKNFNKKMFSGENNPNFGNAWSEKQKLSNRKISKKKFSKKDIHGKSINHPLYRKYKLKKNGKYNKIDEHEIIKLYRKYENSEIVANIIGCSPGSVYLVLHQNNIELSGKQQSGEKNGNWRGGIQYEPYNSDFNNKFKRSIRKRDNQICMLCWIHREKLKRSLCVHHVNYDKLLSIKENCISLCDKCHGLTNYNRQYWIEFFQTLLSEEYGYKYSENQEIILEIIDG